MRAVTYELDERWKTVVQQTTVGMEGLYLRLSAEVMSSMCAPKSRLIPPSAVEFAPLSRKATNPQRWNLPPSAGTSRRKP
eukprot:9126687-Pyramimonas_sp.AAC.1